MVIFDSFFVWLFIAAIIIALCSTVKRMCSAHSKSMILRALFDSMEDGFCYLLKVTKDIGRKQYSVITKTERGTLGYMVFYNTIAYNAALERYERSDIEYRDTMENFLRKYEKTNLTIEYFNMEKYS